MKKLISLAAIVAAGALALSGCAAGSPNDPSKPATGETAALSYDVNTDFDLADSPTWTRAKEKGQLTVGVKFDYPGVGNKKPGQQTPEGFDIEMTRMIAAHLGFAPEEITFMEITAPNRELFLQQGKVDMVAAIYTINDERKKVVDFAGPYLEAGQDLLVANDSDITGVADLKDKKVCSVDGATPAQRMQADHPEIELVTYDALSKCMIDLESGNVDAVTHDDVMLRGFAAEYGDQFRVVGERFSTELLGLGVPKGDDAFRNAVNDAIQAATEDGTWKKMFEATLGDTTIVNIPEIDRY
ncbi:glutamate ABC transporter substrate-binding protein [Leucobacter sp. UT-8R-CII-1-4]|uniref:glutamate ABC transporter substrate-binding protein n=1 Tax=Leucobacter sp. UT-8R-CII-1-4 TaxID=3040075 RepID=UPI0024A9B68A|nr:glutamate ABC transporter substrate-binding protein [Leucobacter sp. UT-8R-CII-1-4]MDI6022600.1 glutamate ABC transporter substrate-binding protein [Leucobacter sp. UT-8R-CII-1-4]